MLQKERSSLLNQFSFTATNVISSNFLWYYRLTREITGESLEMNWIASMFKSDRAAEAKIQVFKAIKAGSNLKQTMSDGTFSV